MKKMMKSTVKTGLFVGMALLAAQTAQAHEFRAFGQYIIGIGSTIEPPQVGVANGIDVFAQYDQDPGPGIDLVNLDRAAGDTVNISVIPITVKTESYNGKLVEADEGVFNDFDGLNEIEDGEFGYQATGFTPDADDVGGTGPHTGYLGYYVSAHLKKVGQPGKVLILKKFVCGAGSKDVEFGSSFDCVIP
ncbi:MAG: hypothetical protein HOP34_03070 [Methylococcaceae bacterium]|nr:hypothetical protein [Methylococcaceae bacterium]